jgi:hypothetical protein
MGQNDTSASQPMSYQQNVTVAQPTVQVALVSQQMDQINALGSPSMTQHQHTASLLQPITPTEVLISRLPHQNGVNWVFHDPVVGTV